MKVARALAFASIVLVVASALETESNLDASAACGNEEQQRRQRPKQESARRNLAKEKFISLAQLIG